MGKRIKKIACGGHHCLGINGQGKVYSWGSNRSGQLGRAEEIGEQGSGPAPALITCQIFEKCVIKDIACGFQHSLALSNEGVVYAWGLNICGQLGIGSDDHIIYQPQVVKDILARVKQISAGQLHSGAVTEHGELYTWGHNPDCRLFQKINSSNPAQRNCFQPKKVTIKDQQLERKITYVSCGTDHSMVIDDRGEVYAAGNSEWGQLGVPHYEFMPRTCQQPYVKVEGLTHSVKKVSCGDGFSLALSNKGKVYSCGKGNFGRLGHGIEGNINMMVEIQFFRKRNIKLIDIGAGGRHCLALDENQRILYVWGFNFYYQLGQYHQEDELVPVRNIYITQRIQSVACGFMNSAVMVEDY